VETPDNDRLLASAVLFLLDGQEKDAARILARCSLKLDWINWISVWSEYEERHISLPEYEKGYVAELTGPRAAYEILTDPDNPITQAIQRALGAVSLQPVHELRARAQLVEEARASRAELLEIVDGKDVDNQAVEAVEARTWNNLRFRSESEIRIAQALDKADVLFLPNCKARLGSAENRSNKEADFLVCWEGKWGILEVDGEPFHPPSRTVKDHERDRLFRTHGIRVVEHFDATKCFEDPDGVVQQFLDILKKA